MIQFDLIQGDCLEKMQDIPDKSIDMILTDTPYGTTACSWDTIIPLEPMWEQVKRVIKDNGAIALFGSQPFTSVLITGNLKMFKYCWLWEKNRCGNFVNAKRQPMRNYEDIVVFYSTQPTYNPQREPRTYKSLNRHPAGETHITKSKANPIKHLTNLKSKDSIYLADGLRNPTSILKIDSVLPLDSQHPTQKPVKLLDYLIRTYTNENETVLDFTMGSGSTGVACIETNRNFIGIELDENYFNIAKERIKKAQMSPRLFV